ncbi:Imm10 family immunity protein [Acidovorax sp.]|uniref:Imm10 family immunity protein n=1 Tax=Acidovorax sp. TaxID=1872122 RepID=UPI002ACE11D2|nr:Imm10 family immunity protein [Acidovorax sp.]MDZ7862972.1 Imm10 family immunity protein [Acidovorax sp.]
MPAGFFADAFAAVEDDGLLIVTLGAPSTEDEDFYLMLQHQDEYDEQDIELGMDQPYIEYCGQGWSWYGYILSFDLHRDHVRVQMDAQAAREMDNDGLIEVRFDLADAQFHALRLALQRTFAGRSCFHDRA